MKPILGENNRGLKEWAVACEALRDGRQLLLIRKGGIREESGVFTIQDREFFLIPTYDHQNPNQLQLQYLESLNRSLETVPAPGMLRIDTYAKVEKILTASNEDQLLAASAEHLWNLEYIKLRFNFNPYDPLMLLVLRAYRLPQPIYLEFRPEYGGCTSWITLGEILSTSGAEPALSEEEFNIRASELCNILQ